MTDPSLLQDAASHEPVDLATVDAMVLGDVWAIAEATRQREQYRLEKSTGAQIADAIFALVDRERPVFRGVACRDYLDLLAREAEETPHSFLASTRVTRACFVLGRRTDLSFEGLGTAAERFLAATTWPKPPHFALLLARLVNAECAARTLERLTSDLDDHPLLVQELRVAANLDIVELTALAAAASPDPQASKATIHDLHHTLSAIPAIATVANTIFEQAVARVRSIHERQQPYAADKAFTAEEARVLGRLARVALARDESWLPPMLDELFHKVTLAPTAAKTMPSQTVANALGKAVEAMPTPEAVETLGRVLRSVRHAGVEKRLQRHLRGAERGLASRPDLALRVARDQPLSKAQWTTLKRVLETGFASGLTFRYDAWRTRLAEHQRLQEMTASLVWRVRDATGRPVDVLPSMADGRLELRDIYGACVTADPASTVTLWHPREATAADRTTWRDRIVARRIKQPFKQVFREHYRVTAADAPQRELPIFAGHVVSLQPFLALARQEGWSIEDDCRIARPVGSWTVTLLVDKKIFPGATGWANTLTSSVWRSRGPQRLPASFGDLPPVPLSEALRSIDLLVSTSSFAIEPTIADGQEQDAQRYARLERLAARPLSPMADMRMEALKRVFEQWDGTAEVRFDARHLRIGPYAIHLATGRVTCEGEAVTFERPHRSKLRAMPWLPFDEKLLETIASTAAALIDKRAG